MWSNSHTHSRYCDGKSLLEESVLSAKERGVFSLGFSSHAPLPFETKWAMPSTRLDEYLTEIDGLRLAHPELEIYKGLEADFITGRIGPGIFRQRLDYTIGSVHFTDTDSAGKYLEIDGPHPEFLSMLERVYKGNIREAIVRYFELTEEMLRTDCPDVLGHVDKIKIQNTGEKFFRESEPWYRESLRKLVNTVKSSGVIVEVNTRGIYKKKSDTPYPSPWVLELLHEKRIPVTLNSDAHVADELVFCFPETAGLLLNVGFKEIMCLKGNQWQSFQFDVNGIKV